MVGVLESDGSSVGECVSVPVVFGESERVGSSLSERELVRLCDGEAVTDSDWLRASCEGEIERDGDGVRETVGDSSIVDDAPVDDALGVTERDSEELEEVDGDRDSVALTSCEAVMLDVPDGVALMVGVRVGVTDDDTTFDGDALRVVEWVKLSVFVTVSVSVGIGVSVAVG